MVQLYITRSKIFLAVDKTGAERRFTLGRGALPQSAPDWVRNTLTYEYGVKDKSIVDLTPPPTAVVPKAVQEPEEATEDPVEPEGTPEDEDASTEPEVAVAKPAGKGKKTGGKAVGLQ